MNTAPSATVGLALYAGSGWPGRFGRSPTKCHFRTSAPALPGVIATCARLSEACAGPPRKADQSPGPTAPVAGPCPASTSIAAPVAATPAAAQRAGILANHRIGAHPPHPGGPAVAVLAGVPVGLAAGLSRQAETVATEFRAGTFLIRTIRQYSQNGYQAIRSANMSDL